MADSQILKSYGIEYDSAIARFAGNDALYLKFLNRYVSDNYIGMVTTVFDGEDPAAMDSEIHKLKGVAANLGLDEIASIANKIMGLLRAGEIEKARGLLPELSAADSRAREAIAKC